MLLQGKVAVVHGAGGAVGGAVARAFAAQGAVVHLAGHRLEPLQQVQGDIRSAGGSAEVAQVDAMDCGAVGGFLGGLPGLDISFNAIGLGDAQGVALRDMTLAHFLLPVEAAVRTHFVTGVLAGKVMAARGKGVILGITANPAKRTYPNAGGFGVACAAIEAVFRQLAVEFGPFGVRATVLRSAGSPDAPGVGQAMDLHAARLGITRDQLEAQNSVEAPLKRMPRLAEVANAAVLAASDLGSAMTANVLNVTCGAQQE